MANYKSFHTGLEIDGAVDKATLVEANPVLSASDSEKIKSINIAGAKYKISGGVWGDIEGDISKQTDLVQKLAEKQDSLNIGNGLKKINNNLSVNTDIIATKEEIPSGEIDVKFNGVETNTTEELSNIIIENKTYTITQHITAENYIIGS